MDCLKKAKQLQLGASGAKIKGLMQDQETDSLDLLVREVLQNSTDAIQSKNVIIPNTNIHANSTDYGSVLFNLSIFSSKQFMDKIGDLEFKRNLLRKVGASDSRNALVVQDRNTRGLCGVPYDNEAVKPNNLNALVYDFLSSHKESGAGGSHGIGKTVYYRFGAGLVLFYSHTWENDGTLSHKLAGLYLEDTSAIDHILDPNKYMGAVFLGINSKHNDEDLSIPITDEDEISSILSIFGLNKYPDDCFGTTIIIPYIQRNDFFRKILVCTWLLATALLVV